MPAESAPAESTPAPAGIDPAGFARWLARTHPELATAETPEITLITGGKSNITYRVHGTARPLVLRRPPLGHVLASAHDMGREHRVIAALGQTAVPVPGVVDLVDDTEAREVTGTVFFVMHEAPGRVLAKPRDNAGLTARGLHAIGIELAERLAELHAVDAASVGLDDFGRPDGYLARQVATWRRQLEASRSREVEGLDALAEQLAATVPQSGAPAIVHGDYRLDNVLVTGEGDTPTISAILDWEMATLGDPLLDLGILSVYWALPEIDGAAAILPSAVDVAAGSPSFEQLVDAYAARADIHTPELGWYRSFAAFKLAVIAEGIFYRYQSGNTLGAGFDRFGEIVPALVEHARSAH